MGEETASLGAFGAPGIEPRWTHGAKDAVGTAYSAGSDVWFTIARGHLTEIYYPTIDKPQVRDVTFLVSDGETFVEDEKRHTANHVEKLHPDALGYVIESKSFNHPYTLHKEVIADPHAAVVLIRLKLSCTDAALAKKLRLYILVAPHLDGDGGGDSGLVTSYAGRQVLAARGAATWMMVGVNGRFLARSVGYVGSSDGWQDLMKHKRMTWAFDRADNGNIALCGEIDVSEQRPITIGLAFGDSDQRAASTLFQSLGARYTVDHRPRFIRQWQRAATSTEALDHLAGDGGRLYRTSHALLLAHEDKRYPGALIASMAIPWGDSKGDEDIGGYHLVWTRDMCNSSSGLLATGDITTPLRSLIYLACTQRPDGGFYQNFWIDGRPYWRGIQLDEVSFPIVLAWRLWKLEALGNFDPWDMVRRAAAYVVAEGPATHQERWEENSGYSPSTLASNIAGLVCAADFARARGETAIAEFLLEHADFLESHVEAWTVTSEGSLLAGVPRHYIRIHPVDLADPECHEDPNRGILGVKNRMPGTQWQFPAKDVVDAGFLELVRYGIRRAGDPLIEDSLRVIDAVLRVETHAGPVWKRYNHDGYGEGPNGEPFKQSGIGRPWPLLTGERGHYELAAGRDVRPYLGALEKFANEVGLLPEQVWDQPDLQRRHLRTGKPTGAAMPLMWAHAEYIKLLRSTRDGRVFDVIQPVAERYLGKRARVPLEVWKFNRRVKKTQAGTTVRVMAGAPFLLKWSSDGWRTATDSRSTGTKLGLHYVDLPTARSARAPLTFTFLWTGENRWEGRDFSVEMLPDARAQAGVVAGRPLEMAP